MKKVTRVKGHVIRGPGVNDPNTIISSVGATQNLSTITSIEESTMGMSDNWGSAMTIAAWPVPSFSGIATHDTSRGTHVV